MSGSSERETKGSLLDEGVKATLESIRGKARAEAATFERAGRRWGRLYFLVGLPATVLAAVAGATALGSTAGRVPAGILALASAGLGSAVAFLDSGRRQKDNEALAAGWEVLANDAELHLRVDIHNEQWVTISGRSALQTLLNQQGRLSKGKVPERVFQEGVVSEGELISRAAEVLRGAEESGRPILITRGNRIVAGMQPTSLAEVVDLLIKSSPNLLDSLSVANKEFETGDTVSATELFLPDEQ